YFYLSRGRHTRSKRDWSSDVCSSDLLCLFDLAEGSTSAAEVLPFPAPTHQEMPFRTEGRCSFYKRYQKRGSPWKKRCGAPASSRSEERRVGEERRER